MLKMTKRAIFETNLQKSQIFLSDPDPNPVFFRIRTRPGQKSGSDGIRIHNTGLGP
jgi:hypothetical protein